MSGQTHPFPELDLDLLEIVACPRCHVALQRAGDELLCPGCAGRSPVRDGVLCFVDSAQTPEFAPQGDFVLAR